MKKNQYMQPEMMVMDIKPTTVICTSPPVNHDPKDDQIID